MIEQVKYINHMNEVIDFGSCGLYVNENDLHDYSWKVNKKNEKISALTTGVTKKKIPVVIACETEEEGIRIRNRIFEVAEKDVLAMKYGKLVIGDYYLHCYITGSTKKKYLTTNLMTKLNLTIQTDLPMWVKESTTTFNYGAGKQGTNLDFQNDFPYDYTSNLLGKELNNTDFVPTNFRMQIYGQCDNPKVVIAGHEYQVDVSVGNNEYLTIDSIQKTIILTHADGSKENCFNKRNRESYIFEKMPVGISNVANNGNFKFDITLLEERGEPKWI